MKVVGLVTEYNPFHNGHKYHIEESKRITGADYCIAVMSGNFVQRGVPAMINKYHRTRMALNNGVDLVIELPVCYATASAEFFALGAVSILDQLKIVDTICFGSECGDITLLQKAAEFLLNAPDSYNKHLQTYIKQGFTYPAARSKALKHHFKNQSFHDLDRLTQVMSEPNNILGIEYMKALLRLKSRIVPITIQRISAHYHDKDLASDTLQHNRPTSLNQDFPPVISSATAIRKVIQDNVKSRNEFENMQYSVPNDVYKLLQENHLKSYPITENDFLSNLLYKLMWEENTSLSTYSDITSDLADRMKNVSGYYSDFSDLTNIIKTKNMTLTRINRALLHLLLNIKTDTLTEYNNHGYAQYARILGVKKQSTSLLRMAERMEGIPIITKVSQAKTKLSSIGMQMLNEDLFAAHLYNQAVYNKFGLETPNEYKHGIVIV